MKDKIDELEKLIDEWRSPDDWYRSDSRDAIMVIGKELLEAGIPVSVTFSAITDVYSVASGEYGD